MWLRHGIDGWASSIYVKYPFALEVVVIGDQMTYFKTALLQF